MSELKAYFMFMDSHGSHAWVDDYGTCTWHQSFRFVPLSSIDYGVCTSYYIQDSDWNVSYFIFSVLYLCSSFLTLVTETKVLVPGAIPFTAQNRLTSVYGNPWIASIVFVFCLVSCLVFSLFSSLLCSLIFSVVKEPRPRPNVHHGYPWISCLGWRLRCLYLVSKPIEGICKINIEVVELQVQIRRFK